MPKAKRGAPRTGSMPIIETSSPSTVISAAAASERPARPLTRHSPRSISAKNSGGPNLSANLASGGATSTSAIVATVPPMNEPIAAIAERGAGAALLRHLVSVEAGDHRRRLAGHVDQDRRDRAAVHRAVVDRREHDDRAGRVQLEGERDEDRRAGGRSQARQDADQCAEDAARERVGKVRRAERGGESRGEVRERVHRRPVTPRTGRPAAAP